MTTKQEHAMKAIVSVLLGWMLLTMAPAAVGEVPAFPGAEGYGATATGGRGGRVIGGVPDRAAETALDGNRAGGRSRAGRLRGRTGDIATTCVVAWPQALQRRFESFRLISMRARRPRSYVGHWRAS